MNNQFTWVETHEGIASYLKEQQGNQKNLINLLKNAGVDALTDKKNPYDNAIELDEIDPFTFFCYIYKYGAKRSLDILQKIATELGLKQPNDTLGLPSTNALKVCLFPYKYERDDEHIDKLWDFFSKVVEKKEISNSDFQEILNLKGVGKIKITEVLFYIEPTIYFPIDAPTIIFLPQKFDISPKFDSFQDYIQILKDIRLKTNEPYYKLSHNAFLWNEEKKKERKFWRMGTKDDDQSYWDDMFSNDFGAIGWTNIGDLSLTKSRNDIILQLQNNGYFQNDKRTASRKAGEIFDFFKNANTGDIVLAQDGHTILGIGVITSPYRYDVNYRFGHQKSIIWQNWDNSFSNTDGNLTTFKEITNVQTIKNVENFLNSNNPETDNEMNNKNKNTQPLNQILYGPPGTGKTYNTINKALEIIGFDMKGKSREEIKTQFDKYFESGQIAFTTFHQSMSYEDFIEGIKPITNDGKVIYEIQNGIFKEMSETGRSNYLESKKKPEEVSKLKAFELALEKFKDKINESENPFEINKTAYIIEVEKDAFRYTADNWNVQQRMKYDDLMKFFEADVNTRQDVKKMSSTSGLSKQHASYFFKVYEQITELVDVSNLNEVIANEPLKKYVLIIDEINRGNVSAIFGELITLIEDSKRLGMPEALTVTLPYSKKSFGVPPNLYIIGTMNTADRSVEALDTALRRRFVFEELMPDYDLLKEKILQYSDDKTLILSDLLQTINERIEVLLNRDNLIGHAYFLGVDSWDNLKTTFYKNIIPLLQEYFYGDYGKIGLVLGEGFVRQKPTTKNFATIKGYESGDYDRVIFEIISENKIDIKEAVKKLLNDSE